MSSLNQILEIINYLQKTFKSSDNKEREEAEKKISEFEKFHLLNYIEGFLQLISSSNSNIDLNTKLSIISMLNRVITKNIQDNISYDKRNEIITQYIELIIIPNLNKKLLENLLITLSSLLNDTEKNPEVIKILVSSIEKNINNIQGESYFGLISVLNSISLSLGLSLNNYKEVVEKINIILKTLFENILKNTSVINESNYKQLSELFNILFTLLSNLIFRLKKRLRRNESFILKGFLPFLPVAFKLLVNPNDNLRIISWTNNREIDININKFKTSILKYLNKIADNLPSIIDRNEKDLINNHIELIKIIILDLEFIINHKIKYIINMDNEFNEMYPDNEYSIIIYQCLFYLNTMFQKDTFRVEFERALQKFIKNILFPFLIITKNEILLSESNEEFEIYASTIEDIIENNKSKTIKSSVSLILKNLYNYSSLSSFILKYSILLIGDSLGFKLQYNHYSQDDKINLILEKDKEKKIDVGLLILCIINKVQSTDDNEKELKQFFQQISKILLKSNLPMYVVYKNILLIKGTINDLFEPEDPQYQILIQYLLSNMFLFEKVLISSTAAETLGNIMENIEKNNFDYISQPFLNVIPQLMEAILKTSYNNFFNVLLEITFKINESVLKEFQTKMFINLCQRVLLETEKQNKRKFIVLKPSKNNIIQNQNEENNSNQTFLINKCFNIIRTLMERKAFVQTNFTIIEESLYPLLKYMEDPKRIEFDEDIVLILTKLISFSKKITKSALFTLPYLYKYAEKNEGMLLDLYELVNGYIAYGTKEIENNSELFKSVINIFNASMNSEKFPKSPFFACCLMQIWIMNSNTIPQEAIVHFVNYSFQSIYKLFSLKTSNNIDDKIEFEEEHFNYIGFIVLFFSTFIHYSNITINEMKKLNINEENLLNWINLVFKIELFSDYQIKLLILCFCYMINKDIYVINIKDLLYITFHLLAIQKKNAIANINKAMKKELKCNFVEEDESDDESGDDDNQFGDYDDKAEIADLVSRTINPLKDEDEFKIFKNSIDYFSKKNNDLFNQWNNSLSNNERDNLKQLIETVRINVKSNQKDYSIPRKIVSIKRNDK